MNLKTRLKFVLFRNICMYENSCLSSRVLIPNSNAGQFIISSKERFECDLSSFLEHAWSTRTSERHLYTVYSYILARLCDTIEPPGYPTTTISHTPQACFGIRQTPAGQKGEKMSKRRLVKEQIPDFVRMMLSYIGGDIRISAGLIDLWEIKSLNTVQAWRHKDSASVAERATLRWVEQLYDQAMAAFVYHPTCQHVYALLIIGSYFTQLVWSRPLEIIKPVKPKTWTYIAD